MYVDMHRQILGVPLRHPLTGEAIGLLQVGRHNLIIEYVFEITYPYESFTCR